MISRRGFILSSLRHHWRLHLSLLFLAALTSSLITGALILGDSVTQSLRRISDNRLGRTQWVVRANAQPFRISLSDSVAATLNTDCAPILAMDATVSKPGGAVRLPACRLLGIDQRFFNLSHSQAGPVPAPGEILLNAKTARHLQCQSGDMLLIEISEAGALPVDAPFAQDRRPVTLRLKVRAILETRQFGDFSLQINPETPFNAFVDLAFLAEKTGQPGKCNQLCIARPDGALPDHTAVWSALKAHWRLEDTPLEIRDLPGGAQAELRSRDVFIQPDGIAVLLETIPGLLPVFTYFVNTLTGEGRQTPYSMVSSLPPSSGITLPDDGIVINTWLAQDLGAKPGDMISLQYYAIDAFHRLVTRVSALRVQAVVPLAGWAADRSLMPDFPGLSDAGDCRDWEPGVPIDLNRIRPKDEDYWDQYHGTPKAFITLAKAQSLWRNPFGDLTALRFPPAQKAEVRNRLESRLDPGMFGVQLEDIRDMAQRSADDSIDFSQLFLGLSFFIMLSALWLLSLAFGFSITRRSREIQLMRALGFRPRTIRNQFMGEGAVIVCLGAVLGIPVAAAYNQALLFGLKTIWFDAVRTTALETFITPQSLAIGFFSALAASLLAMRLALKSQFKPSLTPAVQTRLPAGLQWANRFVFVGLLAGLAFYLTAPHSVSALFFVLAGTVALANGLIFFLEAFPALGQGRPGKRMSLSVIARQNIAFRRNNSLSVIVLLAIGIFMVVAVSANRQDVAAHAGSRASGTGGYSLFVRTIRPLNGPLSDPRIQTRLGLEPALFQRAPFASLRLKSGNDASCLNINRTLAPAILGVAPQTFPARSAFTFSQTLTQTAKASPWTLLDQPQPDGSIPAIADQTVIQWGLGKKLGDILLMSDDRGRPIRLRLVAGLANSVFQGYVIIGEQDFLRHFSASDGFRVFLCDAPRERMPEIRDALTRSLSGYGIVVEQAAERLAEFNTVQNTYLSIFLLLGGLGLMLSTLGLGAILFRNILERRNETALLWAIGFSRKRTALILFTEYSILLSAGVLCGTVAALIAVLPALRHAGGQVPYIMLVTVILGIAATGTAVLAAASRLALPRTPLDGLRSE